MKRAPTVAAARFPTAGYDYTNGYRDSNGVNQQRDQRFAGIDANPLRHVEMAPADAAGKRPPASLTSPFQTAEQSQILNAANAYFQRAEAIDTLSYTQAQKDAVSTAVDQTTQRLQRGRLVAITDVQNARSNYDTVLAAEVSANNDLDNLRWKRCAR